MKRILAILLVLTIVLTGCGSGSPPDTEQSESKTSEPFESPTQEGVSVAINSLQPETPDADSQSEVVENSIQAIKITDEIYDIGKTLFPDDDAGLSGRILEDNRLLVTTLTETVIYNYKTGEIIHRLLLPVERLGMEHFYSQEQISDSKYVLSLYDRDLNVLVQHESDRPAIPAIDGKTILYDQYDQRNRIITLNTETGEEKEFDYITLQPNDGKPYEGSIWIRSFDGENVFFSTTRNPVSVNSGIGALNIITGVGLFAVDISTTGTEFPGIPALYGKNQAIFWQDGSAYGTDGTYFVVMNVADGDNKFFGFHDVGTTACRISDNGEYLVAVDSAWKAETSQVVLANISTYRGDTSTHDGGPFEPISSIDFGMESPIGSDYGGSFSGISISDDGNYICFSGIIEEDGNKRQTLFLYEIEGI